MTEITFPPTPEGFRWCVEELTPEQASLITTGTEGYRIVSIARDVPKESWADRIYRWMLHIPEPRPDIYGSTVINMLSGNVRAELIAVATKARHELQAEHEAQERAADAEKIADALRNAR